jgi:phosphoglucomutase
MNDYSRWLKEVKDPAILKELKGMDEKAVKAAFYKDLEFGTGGLRGLLGAGSACLNIYTVGKVSQGIANFVNQNYKKGLVAISYDSRINSTLFAKTAATIYALNGLHVYIYPALMPTPLLSYAVRYLHTSIGVMVTASHNPKQYNGYKVYNDEGCQITLDAANQMSKEIESLDIFKDVKTGDYEEQVKLGNIEYIKPDCLDSYLKYIDTKRIAIITNRDLKIIYSPLNGTGLVPVTRALDRFGFKDVTVVPEQKNPDGNFTTCPKPNPELKEALTLGIALLEKKNADLLLVTDPDCDRCGTAVMHKGAIRLINGNEMGILLYDFLLSHKKAVPGSIVVKTIVTSDLVNPIAKAHKMKVVEVLTGFKFIGEQIGLLEKAGHPERFFFGFEESYGYLSGTEVRDKDAVDASVLVAQMMQSFKDEKVDPIDHLEAIYKKYGYVATGLDNFEFDGPEGVTIMNGIMKKLHVLANKDKDKYLFVNDYLNSVTYEDGQEKKIDLPVSDVLKFGYRDGSTITVRPSGTEPKIKIYYYIVANDEKKLPKLLSESQNEFRNLIKELQK